MSACASSGSRRRRSGSWGARRRPRHDALPPGGFSVLHADSTTNTLAFQRLHTTAVDGEEDTEELVIAFNRSDTRQKIALPGLGDAEIHPLVPIFASRGDLAVIPSLTITLDESGRPPAFALDVPARTAVVYRRLQDEDYR